MMCWVFYWHVIHIKNLDKDSNYKPNLQLIRMKLLSFNELAVFELGFVYYGFSFYEGCVFVF